VTELRVYTYEQAAEILQVSKDWLQSEVGKRAVPHARLGRNVRFTEEHLRAIMDAATVPALAAAPAPVDLTRRRTKL
jgi:excisionase family DNA binding protein